MCKDYVWHSEVHFSLMSRDFFFFFLSSHKSIREQIKPHCKNVSQYSFQYSIVLNHYFIWLSYAIRMMLCSVFILFVLFFTNVLFAARRIVMLQLMTAPIRWLHWASLRRQRAKLMFQITHPLYSTEQGIKWGSKCEYLKSAKLMCL